VKPELLGDLVETLHLVIRGDAERLGRRSLSIAPAGPVTKDLAPATSQPFEDTKRISPAGTPKARGPSS